MGQSESQQIDAQGLDVCVNVCVRKSKDRGGDYTLPLVDSSCRALSVPYLMLLRASSEERF